MFDKDLPWKIYHKQYISYLPLIMYVAKTHKTSRKFHDIAIKR